MKRLLALLLASALALSLAACGGGDSGAEDTEAPEESEAEETAEPSVNPFEDIESCAEYAISKLEDVLKNPSSLVVNNLHAVEADDGYIFDIDYSAENGFGGMNRDDLYLAVHSIKNGFAVNTYGTGSYAEAENQRYSAQFFDKYNKVSGAYIFDPETLTVLGIDESGIDPYIDERVELTGKMKGEKPASTGFGGAWDFQVGEDPFLKVVYFTEGTDLSWYKHFTGLPYEITISAIKDEDGHYREAEIVEDEVRNATDEERLERFNYYDRVILEMNIPTLGLEPMTAEAIHAALDDKTFSMRNNYGGDGDGTHSITFHADGTLDAMYTYEGEESSMYESWGMEDDSVVCTHSFTNMYGQYKTVNRHFTAYQYDETRYLLMDQVGDFSMVLTQK